MSMVLGALSAAFWGIVLLSVVVFVHEGGHFLAARAFGVRVTEFYLGLPSRFKICTKSRRYGTEFGVSALLLGGFNRICGMNVTDDGLMASAFGIVQREGRVEVQALADELEIELERAYDLMASLSDIAAVRPYYNPDLGEYPTQRDYPAAFETLARDAHMLTEYDKGHDFTQEGSTADAEPRPLESNTRQLDAEMGRSYLGMSLPKRLVMLFAGPLVNLLLAFVLVTGAMMSVEYEVPVNSNVVGEVTAGSLADAAGLQAGDTLLSVGDAQVSDWISAADALKVCREAGQDFEIVYERDGQEHTALVDMPEGEEVELIGLSASMEPYHLSLAEAMQGALNYAGMVGSVAVRVIMPQHTMEVIDQSTSVVGISVMASEAVSSGPMDVLALVAAVSMSLGFMNLLPIPPLDGGKIMIELIEAAIRKPLSMRAKTALSYVGLALFMILFVVVLQKDLVRFVLG